jgi:hypothetical protein
MYQIKQPKDICGHNTAVHILWRCSVVTPQVEPAIEVNTAISGAALARHWLTCVLPARPVSSVTPRYFSVSVGLTTIPQMVTAASSEPRGFGMPGRFF